MNAIFQTIWNTFLPVICWLFCAITSSKLAYKKNRNTQTWFMLGLFFGLVALIIIYFLKPLKNIKKSQKTPKSDLSNRFAILQNDNHYWYYLNLKHEQIGPMSLKALYNDYLKEEISNNTYVWNDTMTNWKKLIDISVLSTILKSTN